MNHYTLIAALLLCTTAMADEFHGKFPGAISYQTYTRRFEPYKSVDRHNTVTALAKELVIPYPLHAEKRIPYAVKIPVAVPVDRPVAVHVPKPYPVPIVTTIPYPVEKPIPYPIKLLHPVGFNQQPYAVLTKLPYTSFSPSTFQPLQHHSVDHHQQQRQHQQLFNQQYH